MEGRWGITDDGGLQVHKHSSGDMFPSTGLAEEGVEGMVVVFIDKFVAKHLPVGLDPVLHAVELPAGVPNLDAGLTHVDGDALTLPTKHKKQLLISELLNWWFTTERSKNN